MLILRALLMLAVLGVGAAMVLWLLTGKPRYRTWAWKIFRVSVMLVFAVLALFAIERVLAPML
ncbi:hypothetical protein M622_03690 [Thauera terpenica 58Eu]|jgi:heme O synthase-like polyprenyltransferase|uniref:Uncharacterized protein n=1 Tax=Thauera terpenica 58Eu TaxID=1348657 RepID=T0AXD7_9RHOO|nr:hypothetical protein [Thauera terpenica]EPZ15238.1 hypothetical protein M622_03690 [Thauera terpenica 58Eu]MBP6761941.1 hypothetical protein [Thauera sp.]